MTLLEQVKTALRISSDVFDEGELEPLIAACKIDLSLAGVNALDESDPIITRAVILYAKANFGYIEDSARWQEAYTALKCSLALSGDYGEVRKRESG